MCDMVVQQLEDGRIEVSAADPVDTIGANNHVVLTWIDRDLRFMVEQVLLSLDPFPRYLVASGSLPPGVPNDFYARIARLAHERKARLVLDTSGPPLKEALAEGVFLIKPNLNELSMLFDAHPSANEDAADGCRQLISEGVAEVLALTLGNRGALLVSRDATLRAPALPVETVSAVGAGDSFLGGMVWSLASDHALDAAFRYGVAAGTAALLFTGNGALPSG